MELLFGFREAGPQKGHCRREVEGWAGQTGTDEDTGAGWQGGRVAGLHGSHHPHQLQQTASDCSQRGKFVEGKKGQTRWKLQLKHKRYCTVWEVCNLHKILECITDMKASGI